MYLLQGNWKCHHDRSPLFETPSDGDKRNCPQKFLRVKGAKKEAKIFVNC